MAGQLVAGWEKAAVAHASCRPRRRVVPTRARPATPKSRLAPGLSLSRLAYRRHAWRRSAAEEVVEETVPENKEEGSQGDAPVEEPLEEAVVEEGIARVRAVATETLFAWEDRTMELEDLQRAFDDVEEVVAGLYSNLAAAEAEAAASSEEENEQQKKYLRLSADFDNFRKRSASEKSQLQESVTSDVILQLLPIIDNFELARGQVNPTNEGEEKINNSYQGLYKQMVETFKTLGVEPINAKGQPFDPEIHEAIMREPNDDVPDGTVLDEFRRGFTLKGKLMRAAMVKVSHAEEAAAAPPPVDVESEASEGAPEGGEGSPDGPAEGEAPPKQNWKEVSPE